MTGTATSPLVARTLTSLALCPYKYYFAMMNEINSF